MAKNLSLTNPVTIATSGTTSTAHEVRTGYRVLAIETPATLTGTAFTFEASADGGTTYRALYNGGSAYSVNVGTSRYIALDLDVFEGVRLFRIVSGSTETGTRTINIITGDGP